MQTSAQDPSASTGYGQAGADDNEPNDMKVQNANVPSIMPDAANALAALNGLTYKLPPSIAVATSRTQKDYFATNDAHELGVDPIRIHIASGNNYIDTRNSYLTFDVVVESDPGDPIQIRWEGLCLPSGASWLNMFSGFRINHASGVEVDRMNVEHGMWQNMRQYYDKSSEWRATVGSGLLGLSSPSAPASTTLREEVNYDERRGMPAFIPPEEWNVLGGTRAANGIAGQNFGSTSDTRFSRVTVTLPLSELFEIFNKDELAPPFLMAGLQIEMQTLRKESFFQVVQNFGTYRRSEGYILDNPPPATTQTWNSFHPPVANVWPDHMRIVLENVRVSLCSYSLTDAMARRVSQISAMEGLEWNWTGVAHMSTLTDEEQFTMSVSQALSRANALILKARLNSRIDSPIANHFASLTWIPERLRDVAARFSIPETAAGVVEESPNHWLDGTCLALQARLGAMYVPAQPISGGVGHFYQFALQTFQALRARQNNGIPLVDYAGQVLSEGRPYTTAGVNGLQGNAIATMIARQDDVDPDVFTPQLDTHTEGFLPSITTAAQCVYAIPLTTSSDLPESGLAISAQRTAELNVQFRTITKGLDTWKAIRRYDLFIPHTKVATLYLSDTCVVRT